MRLSSRLAWACISRATQAFHWVDYAPFGWILGAQILFLLLAVNLGSGVGMATVGGVTRMLQGDEPIHYPGFFLYLPSLASILEAFLYAIPGSVIIPLALTRILYRTHPAQARAHSVAARLRHAFLPTLLAWVVEAALLVAWQWAVSVGPSPFLTNRLPGNPGIIAIWAVSVLGAYAIAALFVYVPMVAIRPEYSFVQTIREGFREGFSYFPFTLTFILVFSLSALPFLFVTQLSAESIVDRLQPELVALLLAIYSAIVSVASYLIFAAAMRLHEPVEFEET